MTQKNIKRYQEKFKKENPNIFKDKSERNEENSK